MASTPPVSDVGKEASAGHTGDFDLDKALRDAVLTLEDPNYQKGNPAFDDLTARDWIIMAVLYVAIPVVLALVVGAA